jgi:hypothetical protein
MGMHTVYFMGQLLLLQLLFLIYENMFGQSYVQ